MAIAHNGNLVNARDLREKYELNGGIFHNTNDTEVISYAITEQRLIQPSIEKAVEQAMYKFKGAYSLVIMSPKKLIEMCIRDRYSSVYEYPFSPTKDSLKIIDKDYYSHHYFFIMLAYKTDIVKITKNIFYSDTVYISIFYHFIKIFFTRNYIIFYSVNDIFHCNNRVYIYTKILLNFLNCR